MRESGLASFDEVWDMTGMKAYFYFEETGEDWRLLSSFIHKRAKQTLGTLLLFFNLLEETNAISIPEKNAESKRVIITIVNDILYLLILNVPFASLISYSVKSGVDLKPIPEIISSSVLITTSRSV